LHWQKSEVTEGYLMDKLCILPDIKSAVMSPSPFHLDHFTNKLKKQDRTG
jgi:hypothetical protein